MAFSKTLLERLSQSKVVAGFSVDEVSVAVSIAKALLAGGIDAIELTLRTPVALDAVKAVCDEVPEMIVGVGTILTPEAAKQVKAAGASFGVAPGTNPRVVEAAVEAGLPFAPGIATPSDIEAALELDCRFLKVFPAGALGGIPYLRSMAAPFRHLGLQYFPLGGVNDGTVLEYLAEDNVPVVGGSWITDQHLVERRDWPGLTAHAASIRRKVNG